MALEAQTVRPEFQLERLVEMVNLHQRALDIQLQRIGEIQANLDAIRAAWTRRSRSGRRSRLRVASVVIADLADFSDRHRTHGTLTGDATEPADQGYMLTVECPCGVTFMRWITKAAAVSDFVTSSLLVKPN